MKLIAIPRVMRLALAAPVRGEPELDEATDLARHGARRAMMLVAVERLMRQQVQPTERNNVGRFLAWSQKASPEQRAKAASTLAGAYLREPSPTRNLRGPKAGRTTDFGVLRRDAELCLAILAEDSSIAVRRALAAALADARDAPREIITTLANDEPDVAAIVLAHSPVLSDAELAECATFGCATVQIALARRQRLSAEVAVSLAENDRREVALALIENPAAELPPAALRRIGEHFGQDHELRDALLARAELPAALRYDLIAAATGALPFSAPGRGERRNERLMRDALERCAIRSARSRPPHEVSDLVRHLRTTGALTTALLLRALVSGDRGFFDAAAVELTGMSAERIAGFTREPFGLGFAALYRRMGLPGPFLPPFRAALAALEDFPADHGDRVLRPIVARVIACCESEQSPGLPRLLSLLRRLEAEAALGEARAVQEGAPAAQAELQRGEQAALAPPIIVIEPGLVRMLSLLRSLEEEAEATLAELEAAESACEAERQISDGSLAAWFQWFEALDCSPRHRTLRPARLAARAA
jgi:uncharacterized protein (DUF2336 family)